MTDALDGSEVLDGLVVLQEAAEHLGDDVSRWIASHSNLIVGSGVGAIGLAAALLAVRRLGVRLSRRGDPLAWRAIFGRTLAKTGIVFILAVAARLMVNFGNAPRRIAEAVDFIFTIVATIQVAVWAREIVLGHVDRRAGSGEQGEALENAINIIRLIVTFVIYSIATIVVLDNLGVNIAGLVAGLGIGGLALGIAARGIFEDLFAALSILFDKPFQRGDMIRWDNTQGVIELIGLKTTRIRALSGEEVIVSNANLLDKQLHNLARQAAWRQVFEFGVVYQTPPELVGRIPQIVREVVESHPKRQLLICGMTGFAPSSLNFEVHFDIDTDDLLTAFTAKSETGIALLRRFADEGIEFAYPTQTTFIVGPDGQRRAPRPPGELGLRH